MLTPVKRILVTGASSPLGRAISLHFASPSIELGLHFHQGKDQAFNLASEIEEKGGHATTLQADLSVESECEALVKSWLPPESTLDILINNAGHYPPNFLSNMSAEDWHVGIASTATATFLITRATLPFIRKTSQGRIINIGDSSCDRIGSRNQALGYHTGKTGVLMLTKSFAQQEAKHGITVNMISPGYLENSVELPELETIPARRFGTFEDVTHTIDFLIQPESGYCNGSNLILSGGWNI
ncbi:MAG: SDR family NAD(P)-dependent oxidoreductase [Verrucomicrobiota bacterium]